MSLPGLLLGSHTIMCGFGSRKSEKLISVAHFFSLSVISTTDK